MPQLDTLWTAICVSAVGGLLIYPLLHMPWVLTAQTAAKGRARRVFTLLIGAAVVGLFGWKIWPVAHRHDLSEREVAAFTSQLQNVPKAKVTVACAPYAEADCAYAVQFVSIFGKAGWDVTPGVQNWTGGFTPGIVLIGHTDNSSPTTRWDEGRWVAVTRPIQAIHKAFRSVGTEVELSGSASVPIDSVVVFIGHERENESAPTASTPMLERFEHDPRPNFR